MKTEEEIIDASAERIKHLPGDCSKYEVQRAFFEGANFNKPKWINVEKLLPEKDIYILIFRNGSIDIDYTDSDFFKWHKANSITHWMPSPEPPTQ